MYSRKHTTAYFILEGMNSFGTTLYFFYIYFFTKEQFGFTDLQNLVLAAALGLAYGVASAIGGRFAQRRNGGSGAVPAAAREQEENRLVRLCRDEHDPPRRLNTSLSRRATARVYRR